MQNIKLENSDEFAVVESNVAQILLLNRVNKGFKLDENGEVIFEKNKITYNLAKFVYYSYYCCYNNFERALAYARTSDCGIIYKDGNKLNLLYKNIEVTEKRKLENSDAKTIVNKEIVDDIEYYDLTLDSNGYVNIRLLDKTVRLHRYIYSLYNPDFNIDDSNIQLDHKDRNPLNNTIENLRIATSQQNGLNKEKYSNNSSGIKCISFSKSKKWRFRITLDKRLYEKTYYNSKEEAYCALKYLVDKVANKDEKDFIHIEEFDVNLSDEQKNNIMKDIDEYIEKTKINKFKELVIKKPNYFIHKNNDKYQIKITIFNKAYCFGKYNSIEEAKPYRDFLVNMFNNINEENYNEYEEKIKNKFSSSIIQQNIYKIINKKLNSQ